MNDDQRILVTLRRFAVILPLLALPFAPAIGKMGADLVISITATHDFHE